MRPALAKRISPGNTCVAHDGSPSETGLRSRAGSSGSRAIGVMRISSPVETPAFGPVTATSS
jgi:hypothetical protein